MEKKYKIVGKLETQHNSLTVSVKKPQMQIKIANLEKSKDLDKNKKISNNSPKKQTASQSTSAKQAATMKEFKCLVCNIVFMNRNLLLKHLNISHGVPLLKCDLCSDQFADLVYLKRHKMNVHRNEKRQPQKLITTKRHEQIDEELSDDNEDVEDITSDTSNLQDQSPGKESNNKILSDRSKSREFLKKESSDQEDQFEVLEETNEYENDETNQNDSWWDAHYRESSEEDTKVLETQKKSRPVTKVLKRKNESTGRLQMFGRKRGRPTEAMLAEWKRKRTEYIEADVKKVVNVDRKPNHSLDQGTETSEKKRKKRVSKKEPKEPKEYSGMCQICGEIKVCLAAHIRKVHAESSTCPHCCRKIIANDSKPHECTKKRLSYKCICGEEFVIKEQMQGHLLDKNSTEHGVQCWHCEASFDDIQLYLDHQEEAHPAPFICDICHKGFYKKPHLQMHVYYIHLIEREIKKCNVCGADCAGERSLKRHISRVHRNTGRIACEICNLSCYDRHTLKRHMDNKHSANKKFICDVCKKDFATADALKYHFTIHTGERPYPCPFCPKSFKVNSELRKHYRAHKDLTVKCPSCNIYCLNEEDLRKHIRRFPAHDVANKTYVVEEIE
ncbi:zinc finger protein 652-like [Lutzomyia longipalpis]|uniref:zinc finger protein 652-like n=1 Tax=Lutzomyia longipalpis TaxID=7200 RepID=UPI002483F546|nr:zinc finger protein 652-like [Lutzomyia longipalpis]